MIFNTRLIPPLSPYLVQVKVMVNKWATQLGHKAYYEAHGCVDPMSTLHGRQSGLAGMGELSFLVRFIESEQ